MGCGLSKASTDVVTYDTNTTTTPPSSQQQSPAVPSAAAVRTDNDANDGNTLLQSVRSQSYRVENTATTAAEETTDAATPAGAPTVKIRNASRRRVPSPEPPPPPQTVLKIPDSASYIVRMTLSIWHREYLSATDEDATTRIAIDVLMPELTLATGARYAGITSISRHFNQHHSITADMEQTWCMIVSKLCPFIEHEYIRPLQSTVQRHWTVYAEFATRVHTALPMLLQTIEQRCDLQSLPQVLQWLPFSAIHCLQVYTTAWDPLRPQWLAKTPTLQRWYADTLAKLSPNSPLLHRVPNAQPLAYQPVLSLSSSPGSRVIRALCTHHRIPAVYTTAPDNTHRFRKPLLQDGDYELSGEMAILQYIALKTQSELMGDRIHVDQMLTWLHGKLLPTSMAALTMRDETLERHRVARTSILHSVCEQFLQRTSYLCGEKITLADMYLYTLLLLGSGAAASADDDEEPTLTAYRAALDAQMPRLFKDALSRISPAESRIA